MMRYFQQDAIELIPEQVNQFSLAFFIDISGIEERVFTVRDGENHTVVVLKNRSSPIVDY